MSAIRHDAAAAAGAPVAPLPQPKDLSHHLSRNARSRNESLVKRFYKYFQIPGIGQLAGGLPHPSYFPFDTLEAQTALPGRFKPTPPTPVDPPSLSGLSLKSRKSPSKPLEDAARLLVPHTSHTQDPLKKIDLDSALQYGQALGYPSLHTWLKAWAVNVQHAGIPYEGADVILTCGNTDGFSKSCQLLNDEWREGIDDITERPSLLVEEYAYMTAVQTARPRGMNIVPVRVDAQGMRADDLQRVLANWDLSKGRRPAMMYTVTVGQNPTGGTLSIKRRQDIYKICQAYDVIIVEDDPYWYIQFPSAIEANIASGRLSRADYFEASPRSTSKSGYPFLDSLVPSYLTMDVDGRVIRLDTFSKTIAPGCRMGWITAQPAFVERIQRITETSTQQPSGYVQSMVAELLAGPSKEDIVGDHPLQGKGWGVDGWVRWLEGLRGNYERRMQAMCQILEDGKYQVKAGTLPTLDKACEDADEEGWAVVQKTQMYDFAWPTGGMFIWMEVLFDNHPLAKKVAGDRLSHAFWILLTTAPFRVLISPGTIFAPTEQIQQEKAWRFWRMCFAAVEEKDIPDITNRVVNGVNAFWRIKDEKKIDKLLEEDETMGVGMGDFSSLAGQC